MAFPRQGTIAEKIPHDLRCLRVAKYFRVGVSPGYPTEVCSAVALCLGYFCLKKVA